MRRGGVALVVLMAFGGLLAVPGCGSRPALRVGAVDGALFDRPLGLRVTGARPGDIVHLAARSRDAAGDEWASEVDVTADRDGAVDLAHATPVRGTYTGAQDEGLLWSMRSAAAGGYIAGTGSTMTVTISATQSGLPPATTTVTRRLRADGVRLRELQVSADPFDGYLFTPADTLPRRPGVLVFGGSEGGDAGPALLAQALADHGYPALAVAYFGLPGLPANLENIPLEYFAAAARWLAGQPGVDPARLTVFGWSRGSEAALLLGADFPDVVHAVAVASPSSVVNPGFPDQSAGPWTLGGRPLPHVTPSEFGEPSTATDPAAVIPVDRIAGPVFLLCGEDDRLWSSCDYANAVASRVGSHPATLVREPDAGHLVADVEPGLPFGSGIVGAENYGGTVQADALARLDAWPKLLAFLGNAAP